MFRQSSQTEQAAAARPPRLSKKQIAGTVIFEQAIPVLVSSVVFGMVTKWVLGEMDPNKDFKRLGRKRAAALSKRLGRRIELHDLESVIAQDVIFPEQVDVTLADIGGLDKQSELLTAKVLLPLQRPDLFCGSLLRLEKGVLLYGPPGTGKTMLAKALAKESGAAFLNISASSLQSKWFGETNRLVSALFRLAHKVAPTIIFIDEVDALLSKRRDQEHEATTAMKCELMAAWDGLLSAGGNNGVLLLGATNRPYDLDPAVLRRFSLQLEVGLPDAVQREAILHIHVKRHASEVGAASVEECLRTNVASSPTAQRPLQQVAARAEGLSGSDLHQVCSHAASLPVLELARSPAALSTLQRPRPLSLQDLLTAVESVSQANVNLAEQQAVAVEEARKYARQFLGGLGD